MYTSKVNNTKIILFFSFLYNNHPTKHGVPQVDLSDDEEVRCAVQDNSMTLNQQLIEQIIYKTFAHHKCDVVITDRLRSLFTNKLCRMGKTMHKLGGRGRAQQTEEWKQTKWVIDLKQGEIVPRSKKRKRENVLICNQVKRLKEDLENCQNLLTATRVKVNEAEETNARLT